MVHVTDVLAVSMMLGITAQVKEAGVAWDKGEKKSEELGVGCLLRGVLMLGRRPWVGEGGSALSVGLGQEGRSCSSAPGVPGNCWFLLCPGGEQPLPARGHPLLVCLCRSWCLWAGSRVGGQGSGVWVSLLWVITDPGKGWLQGPLNDWLEGHLGFQGFSSPRCPQPWRTVRCWRALPSRLSRPPPHPPSGAPPLSDVSGCLCRPGFLRAPGCHAGDVTGSSSPDLEVLRSFQNQIAAIQRDAVWWLHTVVPSISKLAPKDYVHWCGRLCLAPDRPRSRGSRVTSDRAPPWMTGH